MQQSRRTSSTSYKQSKPCRDGIDCLLQYDNPTEHNTNYSHPCRWSELCNDMNRNNEHARQYTHDTHHSSPCRHGAEQCTKVTDPEHRRTYRHDGLPDFLIPCKNEDQCRDRSTEHLKKYGHPSSFYQNTQSFKLESSSSTIQSRSTQQACKYGTECRNRSDSNHCSHYSHPPSNLPIHSFNNPSTASASHTSNTGNDMQQACRYGSECRHQADSHHCSRFSHPPSNLPIHSFNNPSTTSASHTFHTANDTQQACRYGSECRHQSDSNHCSRYSHPPSNLPMQSFKNPSTASASHTCNTGNDMQQAYRIGAALALEKLSQSDQKTIRDMPADAIIIIPGKHDHIDRVLNNLNIKYITVEQNEVMTYPFRYNQTVYINCSSSFPADAAKRIRQEVEKGLHIITTDWALKHVLQVAFSDFVRHNGKSTADEVVGIEVADSNHPLVNGFLPACKHAQPQWWLEFGSHPIEIVNKGQVRVLIRSEMLGQKYQSDAVLVTFDCGKGNVIHMVSHFYLQRSETRDARHQMSAKQFAIDSSASAATTNLVANQGQNLNYAQIQSSSTSAQFIYNQIANRMNTTN